MKLPTAQIFKKENKHSKMFIFPDGPRNFGFTPKNEVLKFWMKFKHFHIHFEFLKFPMLRIQKFQNKHEVKSPGGEIHHFQTKQMKNQKFENFRKKWTIPKCSKRCLNL